MKRRIKLFENFDKANKFESGQTVNVKGEKQKGIVVEFDEKEQQGPAKFPGGVVTVKYDGKGGPKNGNYLEPGDDLFVNEGFVNEGYIKNLITLIESTEGDADKDPSKQWTPEEAIDWAVGFINKYKSLPSIPDADIEEPEIQKAMEQTLISRAIVEAVYNVIFKNSPKHIEFKDDWTKYDKQIDNFVNVDWKSSGLVDFKNGRAIVEAYKIHENISAQRYMVMNRTDGFYASPDDMTEEEADKFIQDFPKRFKAQGYYLTSNRERIDPLDVQLEKVPYDADNADNVFGTYNVEMDTSISGMVGNFKLKAGDKIDIEEGKMPDSYKVRMKGATSEFSARAIEDVIATGKIKPDEDAF